MLYDMFPCVRQRNLFNWIVTKEELASPDIDEKELRKEIEQFSEGHLKLGKQLT